MRLKMLHEYENFDNMGQAMQAFFASVSYLIDFDSLSVMWMFNYIRNLYMTLILSGDGSDVSD